jgi:hypothetical protein
MAATGQILVPFLLSSSSAIYVDFIFAVIFFVGMGIRFIRVLFVCIQNRLFDVHFDKLLCVFLLTHGRKKQLCNALDDY